MAFSKDSAFMKMIFEICVTGDLESVKKALISFKYSKLPTDLVGSSPLHYAAKKNKLEVAKVLLESKKCCLENKMKKTPLHFAAQEGYADMCALLIQHGVNVNKQDIMGMTALHWAITYEHYQVVSLLMDNGADPNIEDLYGRSSLSIADVNISILSQLNQQNEDKPKSGKRRRASEDVKEDSTKRRRQSQDKVSGLQFLKKHGISHLPEDNSTTVALALDHGQTAVLTEAGQQLLKLFKSYDAPDPDLQRLSKIWLDQAPQPNPSESNERKDPMRSEDCRQNPNASENSRVVPDCMNGSENVSFDSGGRNELNIGSSDQCGSELMLKYNNRGESMTSEFDLPNDSGVRLGLEFPFFPQCSDVGEASFGATLPSESQLTSSLPSQDFNRCDFSTTLDSSSCLDNFSPMDVGEDISSLLDNFSPMELGEVSKQPTETVVDSLLPTECSPCYNTPSNLLDVERDLTNEPLEIMPSLSDPTVCLNSPITSVAPKTMPNIEENWEQSNNKGTNPILPNTDLNLTYSSINKQCVNSPSAHGMNSTTTTPISEAFESNPLTPNSGKSTPNEAKLYAVCKDVKTKKIIVVPIQPTATKRHRLQETTTGISPKSLNTTGLSEGVLSSQISGSIENSGELESVENKLWTIAGNNVAADTIPAKINPERDKLSVRPPSGIPVQPRIKHIVARPRVSVVGPRSNAMHRNSQVGLSGVNVVRSQRPRFDIGRQIVLSGATTPQQISVVNAPTNVQAIVPQGTRPIVGTPKNILKPQANGTSVDITRPKVIVIPKNNFGNPKQVIAGQGIASGGAHGKQFLPNTAFVEANQRLLTNSTDVAASKQPLRPSVQPSFSSSPLGSKKLNSSSHGLITSNAISTSNPINISSNYANAANIKTLSQGLLSNESVSSSDALSLPNVQLNAADFSSSVSDILQQLGLSPTDSYFQSPLPDYTFERDSITSGNSGVTSTSEDVFAPSSSSAIIPVSRFGAAAPSVSFPSSAIIPVSQRPSIPPSGSCLPSSADCNLRPGTEYTLVRDSSKGSVPNFHVVPVPKKPLPALTFKSANSVENGKDCSTTGEGSLSDVFNSEFMQVDESPMQNLPSLRDNNTKTSSTSGSGVVKDNELHTQDVSTVNQPGRQVKDLVSFIKLLQEKVNASKDNTLEQNTKVDRRSTTAMESRDRTSFNRNTTIPSGVTNITNRRNSFSSENDSTNQNLNHTIERTVSPILKYTPQRTISAIEYKPSQPNKTNAIEYNPKQPKQSNSYDANYFRSKSPSGYISDHSTGTISPQHSRRSSDSDSDDSTAQDLLQMLQKIICGVDHDVPSSVVLNEIEDFDEDSVEALQDEGRDPYEGSQNETEDKQGSATQGVGNIDKRQASHVTDKSHSKHQIVQYSPPGDKTYDRNLQAHDQQLCAFDAENLYSKFRKLMTKSRIVLDTRTKSKISEFIKTLRYLNSDDNIPLSGASTEYASRMSALPNEGSSLVKYRSGQVAPYTGKGSNVAAMRPNIPPEFQNRPALVTKPHGTGRFDSNVYAPSTSSSSYDVFGNPSSPGKIVELTEPPLSTESFSLVDSTMEVCADSSFSLPSSNSSKASILSLASAHTNFTSHANASLPKSPNIVSSMHPSVSKLAPNPSVMSRTVLPGTSSPAMVQPVSSQFLTNVAPPSSMPHSIPSRPLQGTSRPIGRASARMSTSRQSLRPPSMHTTLHSSNSPSPGHTSHIPNPSSPHLASLKSPIASSSSSMKASNRSLRQSPLGQSLSNPSLLNTPRSSSTAALRSHPSAISFSNSPPITSNSSSIYANPTSPGTSLKSFEDLTISTNQSASFDPKYCNPVSVEPNPSSVQMSTPFSVSVNEEFSMQPHGCMPMQPNTSNLMQPNNASMQLNNAMLMQPNNAFMQPNNASMQLNNAMLMQPNNASMQLNNGISMQPKSLNTHATVLRNPHVPLILKPSPILNNLINPTLKPSAKPNRVEFPGTNSTQPTSMDTNKVNILGVVCTKPSGVQNSRHEPKGFDPNISVALLNPCQSVTPVSKKTMVTKTPNTVTKLRAIRPKTTLAGMPNQDPSGFVTKVAIVPDMITASHSVRPKGIVTSAPKFTVKVINAPKAIVSSTPNTTIKIGPEENVINAPKAIVSSAPNTTIKIGPEGKVISVPQVIMPSAPNSPSLSEQSLSSSNGKFSKEELLRQIRNQNYVFMPTQVKKATHKK